MSKADIRYVQGSNYISLSMLTEKARAWGRANIRECVSFVEGIVCPHCPDLEADYYLMGMEKGAVAWFSAKNAGLVLTK